MSREVLVGRFRRYERMGPSDFLSAESREFVNRALAGEERDVAVEVEQKAVQEVQGEKFNGEVEVRLSFLVEPAHHPVSGKNGMVEVKVKDWVGGASAARQAAIAMRDVLVGWQEARAVQARVSGGADEPTRPE